jgi:hypothetical protein
MFLKIVISYYEILRQNLKIVLCKRNVMVYLDYQFDSIKKHQKISKSHFWVCLCGHFQHALTK